MVLDWSILLTVGLAGFFRSAVGWAKNSVEDGAIQLAEWKKLAITFVTFLTIGVLAMFGQNYTDSTVLDTVGILVAFLVNELWTALAKRAAIKKAVKAASMKVVKK